MKIESGCKCAIECDCKDGNEEVLEDELFNNFFLWN